MRVLSSYRHVTAFFFFRGPFTTVLFRFLPVQVLLSSEPVAGHLKQRACLTPLSESDNRRGVIHEYMCRSRTPAGV